MRLLPLPGVFQPPSDSWMLIEQLSSERLPPGALGLDLCTGSGVLAIGAAEQGCSRVVAVDVSRRAVMSATLNAWLNRVTVEAVRGDLFDPVGGERFDLIVSNPPYVPTPSGRLPNKGLSRAWEGGPDGRSLLDRICGGAAAHLQPGGLILLVHSSVCGEEATLSSLSSAGLTAEVAARHRGELGPILKSRAPWLRQQGLLDAHDREEILVIRGRAPAE